MTQFATAATNQNALSLDEMSDAMSDQSLSPSHINIYGNKLPSLQPGVTATES